MTDLPVEKKPKRLWPDIVGIGIIVLFGYSLWTGINNPFWAIALLAPVSAGGIFLGIFIGRWKDKRKQEKNGG